MPVSNTWISAAATFCLTRS